MTTQNQGDTAVGGPGSSPSVEPASGGLDASHSIPIADTAEPFVTSRIGIVTVADRCRSTSERWDRQYACTSDPEKREIGRMLRALTRPEPDVIAAIIGNRSWTTLRCDVCELDVDALACIELFDSVTSICGDCATRAARGIEARRAETGTGSVHESLTPKGTRP